MFRSRNTTNCGMRRRSQCQQSFCLNEMCLLGRRKKPYRRARTLRSRRRRCCRRWSACSRPTRLRRPGSGSSRCGVTSRCSGATAVATAPQKTLQVKDAARLFLFRFQTGRACRRSFEPDLELEGLLERKASCDSTRVRDSRRKGDSQHEAAQGSVSVKGLFVLYVCLEFGRYF